jgi:hypothetical protein
MCGCSGGEYRAIRVFMLLFYILVFIVLLNLFVGIVTDVYPKARHRSRLYVPMLRRMDAHALDAQAVLLAPFHLNQSAHARTHTHPLPPLTAYRSVLCAFPCPLRRPSPRVVRVSSPASGTSTSRA